MTTQNQNWTPEPWEVDQCIPTRLDAKIWQIANFDSSIDAQANCKRAAMCVNACAGMSDPAAEIARLREVERIGKAWWNSELGKSHHDPVGLIATQSKQIEQLQAQVKLLREALQGVVRVADRKTDEFDAARHALTSTEPKS